jgi:hypothetical protein
MLKIDALAIFNNPLVAIEFDLVDPLRHLVEEFGIDINGYEWNNYNAIERYHLLGEAMFGEDLSCLRYLLTKEKLDVNVEIAAVKGKPMSRIMHFAFDNSEVSLAAYEAMASHSSFDANRPVEWGEHPVFPLQYAMTSIIESNDDSKRDKKEKKLMSLLNKFKAHPFYRTPDFRYPAIKLAELHKDDNPWIARIYLAMMEALTIDEQWVWEMTPIGAFNNDGGVGNSDGGGDDGDGDGE